MTYWNFPEIENETRMVAITLLIQHCTGSPKQCYKEQEIKVVLEGNKIFLIYKWCDCLHSKSKRIQRWIIRMKMNKLQLYATYDSQRECWVKVILKGILTALFHLHIVQETDKTKLYNLVTYTQVIDLVTQSLA